METVLTVVLWMILGSFLIGIIWAIGFADKHSNREIHHDSRPGSFYYESNKEKGGK